MRQLTDHDDGVQYRSLGDFARNDPAGYAEAFGVDGDWAGYPEMEPYTDREIDEMVENAYFGRSLPDDGPAPF